MNRKTAMLFSTRHVLYAFLSLLSLAVLLYHPAILEAYAYRDDYNQLYRTLIHHYRFPANTLVEGRPLYWLGLKLIYPWLESFRDFSYLRAFNITLIALFAALLYRLLQQSGMTKLYSFLVAAFTITTPGWGVIAGWAATFQIACGALCGLYAGMLLLERQEKTPWLPALWLVAALCFYQMSAMFFWYPLVLYALTDTRPMLRQAWRFAGVFAVCVLGYTLFYKLLVYWLVDITLFDNQINRIQLVIQPLEKLHWFVMGPLRDSLQLSWLYGNIVLQLLVAVVCLITIVQRIGMSNDWPLKEKLLRFGTLLAIALVSYLPLWFVPENNGEFRLQIVLSAIVVLLVAISIQAISEQRMQYALMIALTLAGSSAALVQFRSAFVAPQVVLVQQVQAALSRQPEMLDYTIPTNPRSRHEYGKLHANAQALVKVLYWDRCHPECNVTHRR